MCCSLVWSLFLAVKVCFWESSWCIIWNFADPVIYSFRQSMKSKGRLSSRPAELKKLVVSLRQLSTLFVIRVNKFRVKQRCIGQGCNFVLACWATYSRSKLKMQTLPTLTYDELFSLQIFLSTFMHLWRTAEVTRFHFIVFRIVLFFFSRIMFIFDKNSVSYYFVSCLGVNSQVLVISFPESIDSTISLNVPTTAPTLSASDNCCILYILRYI